MKALLVRTYPARWRARYGEEFAAVLEEQQLGPFDVADVLLGALDAHLHLRGLGAASLHAKGFAMSLRLGVANLPSRSRVASCRTSTFCGAYRPRSVSRSPALVGLLVSALCVTHGAVAAHGPARGISD